MAYWASNRLICQVCFILNPTFFECSEATVQNMHKARNCCELLLPVQEDSVIGQFLDAAKEETIAALRAELTRLQQSQHAQQAADSALASLQQKIDSLQVCNMLPVICILVYHYDWISPPRCNATVVGLVRELSMQSLLSMQSVHSTNLQSSP